MSHRILALGRSFESATETVRWDENINIKDFDTAVLDLEILDEKISHTDKLTQLEYDSVNIPSDSAVAEMFGHRGTIVAILPKARTGEYEEDTGFTNRNRIITHKYLDWIPLPIDIKEEYGKSVDSNSVDESWRWYFDGNEFEWHLHFEYGQLTENNSIYGVSHPIVKNRYERALAVKITTDAIEQSGEIYLIPRLSGWAYSDLIETILSRIVFSDISEQETEESAAPDWIDEFTVPNEKQIRDRISDLNSEIDNLEEKLQVERDSLEEVTEYKKLLYENENSLEEIVPKTMEAFGFSVEPEQAHHRDGLVHLENTTLVLEITGTTGGVSRSKARQLEEWVEDLEYNNPTEDYKGILIVNPKRREHPENRDGYLSPDVEAYIEKRGHSVLLTTDLFEMYKKFNQGSISADEIEQFLLQDDPVISFE